MKRFCSLCFAAVVLSLVPGCASRSEREIAASVEENFKARWIAKRMGELQASGVADGREARRQALEEFKQQYAYTSVAQKVDPVAGSVMP